MAGANKKCRVCGKEYEACRSAKTIDGVFRWKEVACTPECGAIYLDMIHKSRAATVAAQDTAKMEALNLLEKEYEDDSDDDELYDESEDSEEAEIEV